MIPSIARLRIQDKKKRVIGFFFPLFLFWPLLLALAVALLPFVFLASLVLWKNKKGRSIWDASITVCSLFFAFSGLKIDLHGQDGSIFYIQLI